MFTTLNVLALAGAATARNLEHREIAHRVRDATVHVHPRGVTHDEGIDPCAFMGDFYESIDLKPGDFLNAELPPSLAIACLKNVPLDTARNLALLDYLKPYVEFQSTLELLANPPESYLLPGVDVLGGMAEIERKLKAGVYATQYQVMTDLRSLFAAACDNHFDYPPALLNAFLFSRPGLDFTAISADGIAIPKIYHTIDVNAGNRHNLDYHPSPVSDVDGIPIEIFLQQEAYNAVSNYQDPDAQWNNMFTSIPRLSQGSGGAITVSPFEIPDNHTITFQNGTSKVAISHVIFMPDTNFTGIRSGKDFHDHFEIPAEKDKTDDEEPTTEEEPNQGSKWSPQIAGAAKGNNTRIPGFPEPIAKHPDDILAGYFLETEGYEDTAVLSILSFAGAGSGEGDSTKYIVDGSNAVKRFLAASKRAGKEKLVIDMSANGGGFILLAQELYAVLFPGAKFDAFDRFRYNDAIEALTVLNYETFALFGSGTSSIPVGPDGKAIPDGETYRGPYMVDGQNMTAPMMTDLDAPYADDGTYITGHNPNVTYEDEPVFKPENIVIVTDGTCASACTIFTGLLTRNFGIRTLALGGRPHHIPMQAMGGVRGTVLFNWAVLQDGIKGFPDSLNEKGLKLFEKVLNVLPSVQDAPLNPIIEGENGGKVNGWNGYPLSDLEGLPFHFQYEAANGKLFYTQAMLANPVEVWRRAADVAFHGARCVWGSTVAEDGTLGDESLPYTPAVRSIVSPMEGPGKLTREKRRWT